MSEVRKLALKLSSAKNLDLANFAGEFAQGLVLLTLLSAQTLSIVLFSMTDLRSFTKGFTPVVLSIDISKTAI